RRSKRRGGASPNTWRSGRRCGRSPKQWVSHKLASSGAAKKTSSALPSEGGEMSTQPIDTIDIEAELKRFEAEMSRELGLAQDKTQWVDPPAPDFLARHRAHTTILVSGLTMAHDLFVQGALSGVGYKVKHMDCPDNDALRFGKEFGNRGQCNPTYFTVGNLVKFLTHLRDEKGMSVA